jgi:hypothetical protein
MTRPQYRTKGYRSARAGWAVRVAGGEVACHLCGRIIVGAFDLVPRQTTFALSGPLPIANAGPRSWH